MSSRTGRRALIVVDLQNDFCPGGAPAVERGAEFHERLLDDPRVHVVSKGLGDEDNYSAFDGTALAEELRREGVEEVWVGGLATDYCVKNTLLDALRAGFRARALSDAMRAVNLQPGDDARAIAEMRAAGAEIV